MATLAQIYDSPTVRRLVDSVETAHLAHELGASTEQSDLLAAVNRLRVAAMLETAQLVGEVRVDALLRRMAAETEPIPAPDDAVSSFRKWNAYLTALADFGELPSVDDLLLFSASGLAAFQPTEVRSFLRQKFARDAVRDTGLKTGGMPWSERVRADITVAILFLIRQESHSDVTGAAAIIRRLASLQSEVDASWLESQQNRKRDAMTLLGLYHLAQAVTRLSEFLLVGSVAAEGGETTREFGPELRRLIIKAEQYISLGADQGLAFWLNAVAVVLWRLRSDSIWIAGLGISERLDTLLSELARTGRERPLFSLLPSQQDALRKSLLDPQRIAVVLQMPTSAGKTLLAEFSIAQAFEAYKEETRVVYLVPTRALATQVRRTLAEDLRPLGITVAAAGSAFEEDPYELQLLLESDGVVVATPEKLDLLLRAHPAWFAKLRLVVVDEAHLLAAEERGVRLELLLANLRREQPRARLLLLTPFIENANQIAAWLGGTRGLPIEVQWRPSRLLLGLATLNKQERQFNVEWREPYFELAAARSTAFPLGVRASQLNNKSKKVVALAERFRSLGTVLALFSASPVQAENAAKAVATRARPLETGERSPGLRVAIALARSEYGADATLAYCLERGVAYHHSSLSPILRYLIEDQVRAERINFVAATTTLAQGMNFPVATVLVHSVHKPYGTGDLSPAEFWNIAGRAGRVGMVDKGLVLFVDADQRPKFEHYAAHLTETIQSALLDNLREISRAESLKNAYWQHKELRPFIQYLAHAAATSQPATALKNLEEILEASLANAQISTDADASALRLVSRRYLSEIAGKSAGYLKAADSTGLGSFSFDELYAKIRDDALLAAGPHELLARRDEGLTHLVEALKWIPELSLAIGLGEGEMSAERVARVVQAWIDGAAIPQLAANFPGRDPETQIRNAARYVFGEVSQTISWGAHAYLRGWTMQGGGVEAAPHDAMLGAYIQYGVRSPEAAVASLLGVPRQFAEGFGAEFRERVGEITPTTASELKDFVERSDVQTWRSVVERTELRADVDPGDVRSVVRQMQGLID